MQKSLIDQTEASALPLSGRGMPAAASVDETTSTLIEFPGRTRAVPAWRKQLSQRVREVQEQRAREAAEADAVNRAAESVSCALPSGQLELVPDREQAPMNPIVSKALERVERARRSDAQSGGFTASATAPAFAPEPDEIHEPEFTEPLAEESKPRLTIVAPVINEEDTTAKPKPVRLITDNIDDSALSYLDNYLAVTDSEPAAEPPSLVRRAFAAICDLVFVALLVAPGIGILQLAGADWHDLRNIGIVAGVAFLAMLVYHTVAIAITGRTIAMRMFSLRVMDLRSRMIPTFGQSLKRAMVYILSLVLGGLGIAFALIDRDGRTIHDRFSKSIVIKY